MRPSLIDRRTLVRAAAGAGVFAMTRGLESWTRPEAVAAAAPGRGRWTEKAPLPVARAEVGVATAGGLVNGGSRPSTTNEAFSL